MVATVTSKGQVTVPIEARRRLGLVPGTRLDLIITDDDRLEVIPMTGSVQKLKGMLPKPKRHLTLEEMDDAIAKECVS
jgi:AbrB family looped-hinge helix DNA binding protein